MNHKLKSRKRTAIPKTRARKTTKFGSTEKASAYRAKIKKSLLSLNRKSKLYLATLAFVAFIMLLFMISDRFNTKTDQISVADISAFRLPFAQTCELYKLSEKYKISFSKLLTIYTLDNSFFPFQSKLNSDLTTLEQNYILNYDGIDEKYPQEEFSEYYNLIATLFSEIKKFPIPKDFTELDFMFGDGFLTMRQNGKEIQLGCDVFDRDNQSGRLPVSSMTDGSVTKIAWSETDGHYIEITTINGTAVVYANFESIATGLKIGDSVTAGQQIGKMGNTGLSKTVGATSNLPVSLHIEISPKTGLIKDKLFINPYIILKFIFWQQSL